MLAGCARGRQPARGLTGGQRTITGRSTTQNAKRVKRDPTWSIQDGSNAETPLGLLLAAGTPYALAIRRDSVLPVSAQRDDVPHSMYEAVERRCGAPGGTRTPNRFLRTELLFH